MLPLFALWEARSLRAAQPGPAYWSLARRIGGECRLRWGERGAWVHFPLPDGEGRLGLRRHPDRRAWALELRVYQEQAFGFASRITLPPAPPIRWRAPGLQPLIFYPEEESYLEAGLESTDERLLRWLLRPAPTRALILECFRESGLEALELLPAHRHLLIRGSLTPVQSPNESLEEVGPILVLLARSLSGDLHDLGSALRDSGELEEGPVCLGCGASAQPDPWRCPGCGALIHRGCREMLGGCPAQSCTERLR